MHGIVPCFPVIELVHSFHDIASIDGIPLNDRPQLLVVNDIVKDFGGAHL